MSNRSCNYRLTVTAMETTGARNSRSIEAARSFTASKSQQQTDGRKRAAARARTVRVNELVIEFCQSGSDDVRWADDDDDCSEWRQQRCSRCDIAATADVTRRDAMSGRLRADGRSRTTNGLLLVLHSHENSHRIIRAVNRNCADTLLYYVASSSIQGRITFCFYTSTRVSIPYGLRKNSSFNVSPSLQVFSGTHA